MRPIKYTVLVVVLAASIVALVTARTTSSSLPAATTLEGNEYLPVVVKHENAPSVTPTPTNTPSPQGVVILSNDSHFVWGAFLRIIGEVQNNTSSNLRFIKITANIFNSSGQLLATENQYTYMDPLTAGDKTCFVIFLQEPTGWAYYEFEAPTYQTTSLPLLNISIFNDSGSYDPTFGDYNIIGQVRNDDVTRAEYFRAVGTVFNASGIVLDCDMNTTLDGPHLEPGQSDSFELSYLGRDFADVASYRLQVGYRQ